MVPELDGVRIFSHSTHEFLHEVPGEALTGAPHDPGQRFLGTAAAVGQRRMRTLGHRGTEAELRVPCAPPPLAISLLQWPARRSSK